MEIQLNINFIKLQFFLLQILVNNNKIKNNF